MYSLTCYEAPETVEKAVDAIMNIVRNNGKISRMEVLNLLKPSCAKLSGNANEGWTFDQLVEGDGIKRTLDMVDGKSCVLVEFPDAVDFKNNKRKYDITKPYYYVEGRRYEPRKVIADWDLNFNLGNAVKYIARAGRKNDKIEDLRKAIQYIEFEIEECVKKELNRNYGTSMFKEDTK